MSNTVNFNLRPRKGKKSSIIAVVRLFGYTIRYSTKLTIHPDNWSAKTQRPKQGKDHVLHTKLDGCYNQIREYLMKVQPSDFSPTRTKERLGEIFGHVKPKTNSLIEYSEKYCQGRREKLMCTVNSLRRFQNGRDLFFNEVKARYVARYVEYLKGEGLEASTINFHLSNLNQFLKAAFRQELHENAFRIDKNDKLTIKGDGQIPITLDPSEIRTIAYLKLKGKVAKARDLLLIGIMTGQRHSDFKRITPDMIQNGFIRLTQQKTGKRVSIPLHITDTWGLPITLSKLLEKYNWHSPFITDQMFNRYVKRIAKMCIRSRVEIVKYPAGERTVTIEPKADHITSHVCRRSFCTLLFRSGLTPSTICKYSGHKSEKMLFKYIGITEQEEEMIALKDAERNMKSFDELEKMIPANIRPINGKAKAVAT